MKLVHIKERPFLEASNGSKIRQRVIVADGEVAGIARYARFVFPPGAKAAEHLHDDMTEVFTCESGRGEIRVNDVGYVFSAGTSVVVESGEIHEIINTGEIDLVVTYFGVLSESRND